MRTSKAVRFGLVLLGLVLFATATASAHTVRSRPSCGVVESFDVVTRTVRFAPRNGKAPTEFALTRQTQFIHTWHFAPASELQPGMRAMIYYRTPFFGRPFVTKIVWVNGA